MNHRQNKFDPEDFLDSLLTPDEEAEFKKHLAVSKALTRELKLARELRERLHQQFTAKPTDEYFDEVTKIIMARTVGSMVENNYQRNNSSNIFSVLIKVAASLVLFFGALTLSQYKAVKSPVIIQAAEYQNLTSSANSEARQYQWELTASEFSDMAIGISAVSSPGVATGLYSMTNNYSMRSK